MKAVAVPTYDDFEVVDQVNGRKIYENNGKELVVARSEDSYLSVAKDLNIEVVDLKYINDLVTVNNLPSENFVYLEKKRWRSREYKYHIVRENETWQSIAQLYGIRLPWLHLHNMWNGTLSPGDKVRLRLF
jgi:hypothetical protein